MKRVIGFAVGLSFCCGVSYAATPAIGLDPSPLGHSQAREDTPRLHAATLAASGLQAVAPLRESVTPEELIGRVAYRVSYVGSVILTADLILRSVDSVLGSMEWNRADGTCLRLCAEPASRGFEVGIRLSRPIDF